MIHALRESWRMLARSRSRSVLLFLALSALLLISSQLLLGLENSHRLLSVLFRTVPVDVYLDLPGDTDLVSSTQLSELLAKVDSLQEVELLRCAQPTGCGHRICSGIWLRSRRNAGRESLSSNSRIGPSPGW